MINFKHIQYIHSWVRGSKPPPPPPPPFFFFSKIPPFLEIQDVTNFYSPTMTVVKGFIVDS